MGVRRHSADGKTWWCVDEWLTSPNGERIRFRKWRIPTKEQAEMLAAKMKTETFEGKYFERRRVPQLTVSEVWDLYVKKYGPLPKKGEPRPAIQYDSYQTDHGRAKCLLAHLGSKAAISLTVENVDAYRLARFGEKTVRNKPPMPATLDRELELLKRILNYAVDCKKLPLNPLQRAKFLRVPNVRRSAVDEELFQRLLDACDSDLKAIVLIGFDTGMRKREVLDFIWEQVDLRDGVIRLSQQDTKAEDARLVVLTTRAIEALKGLVRGLPHTPVFPNPATGESWNDIRKMWNRARKAAGLSGLWVHDLRRSFVTGARKAGVAESVVMKMSGHKTRAVFDRYNIVSDEDLRAGVAKLEKSRTVLGQREERRTPETQKAPAN
jgi:integrase